MTFTPDVTKFKRHPKVLQIICTCEISSEFVKLMFITIEITAYYNSIGRDEEFMKFFKENFPFG